jgi:uncharacterized phiE125 gp8 family phage protein
MIPKIVVQPTAEPLTIEECRAHLNIQPYEIDSDGVGSHPDDMMIMAMQSAAREHCENFLGRSLVPKTYEIAMDEFPDGAIELPMPPLVVVESVTAGEDSDGLIDSDLYVVDGYSEPARVVPVTDWPTVTASTNNVRIRYTAGYGEDSDGNPPLPYAIRAALLLMLGHLYEQRSDTADKMVFSVPNGVEAMLRPLRVRLGMA